MKRLLILTALVFSACVAKGPDGTSRGTGAEPFAGNGTITSGGGNGVDGKMTETYRKAIDTLPEYKRYVFPILRRLSQGRPDVLVSYLQWAAHNKVWYFVPRKLQSLPKERIALAFNSIDQLALHSEKEIFIDEPAYRDRTNEEKAYLLLHEMVMGAKLLMKQSPERQCQLLSGVSFMEACRDKETMKLAVAEPDSGTNTPITELGGRDHESVRAMTVALADRDQQLDRASVVALRSRLDFHFPWDHLLSTADMRSLIAAIERSTLAGMRYAAEPSFYSKEAGPCSIGIEGTSRLKFGMGTELSGYWYRAGDPFNYSFYFYRDQNLFIDVSGVPDPRGGNEIVDMLEMESFSLHSNIYVKIENEDGFRIQYYIDRGPKPSIIEYRVIPVARRKTKDGPDTPYVKSYEAIDIKDKAPLRCRAL